MLDDLAATLVAVFGAPASAETDAPDRAPDPLDVTRDIVDHLVGLRALVYVEEPPRP